MANKRGFVFFSFFHILENLTPDVGVILDIFSLVEKVNYQFKLKYMESKICKLETQLSEGNQIGRREI